MQDLKSCGPKGPYGFDSRPRHNFLIISMEDKFICECGKEFKSKNSLKPITDFVKCISLKVRFQSIKLMIIYINANVEKNLIIFKV